MHMLERMTRLRRLALIAALSMTVLGQPTLTWAQETTEATATETAAEAPAEAATSMPEAAASEAAPAEAAAAAPAGPSNADLKIMMDTMWVMVTAMLVFFMNLGFACVESGMCRHKNAVNILSKNFIVFAVTTIGFWVLGWGLMFGNGNGFMGTEGLFLLKGADNSPATMDAYSGVYGALNWTGVPLYAKFFFQLVFAGTAATIVSGAVAERIKYLSFIVFSGVMAIAIYPICGHWIWGGGWLMGKGFVDFAGSTVVHSVGGWAGCLSGGRDQRAAAELPGDDPHLSDARKVSRSTCGTSSASPGSRPSSVSGP